MKWKFFLRRNRERNGKCPIYIEFKTANKTHKLSTGFWIEEGKWDHFRQEAKDEVVNEVLKRVSLRLAKSDVITPQLVKEALYGERSIPLLSEFAKQVLDKKEQLVSYDVIRSYRTDYRRLYEFLTVQGDILVSEINQRFVDNYREYLKAKYNYKKNTLGERLKFLRIVYFEAKRQGLVNTPIKFNISWEVGDRQFLTIEEVKQLEKHIIDNKPKHGDWILFALYTGLRWVDLSRLKWENIQGNKVVLKQHKTGHLVSIPLTQKAQMILPEPAHPKSKVFPHIPTTNQAANKILKRIVKGAGIKKDLTMHALRHTFATVSLELGIPVEVVQRLLGHRRITVTMIYTHIVDKRKEEEMKKWDLL